jgi:hypothetical protein
MFARPSRRHSRRPAGKPAAIWGCLVSQRESRRRAAFRSPSDAEGKHVRRPSAIQRLHRAAAASEHVFRGGARLLVMGSAGGEARDTGKPAMDSADDARPTLLVDDFPISSTTCSTPWPSYGKTRRHFSMGSHFARLSRLRVTAVFVMETKLLPNFVNGFALSV